MAGAEACAEIGAAPATEVGATQRTPRPRPQDQGSTLGSEPEGVVGRLTLAGMSGSEAAVVAANIASAGVGAAWFVSGPAGAGKSWLISQLAAELAPGEVHHVVGRGLATDGQSLGDMLGLAGQEGAALVASMAGGALLVDDIDALETLQVQQIGAICALAKAADVTVVVTQRNGRGDDATVALATLCQPAPLGPLDPLRPTFRALVDQLSDTAVDNVLSGTEGWPELVQVHPALGNSRAASDLVAPRLESLGAEARSLAVAVAFGASLQDGTAEGLTGLAHHRLDAAITELRAAGLLHGVEIAPVVTDAIRDVVPPGERRKTLALILERGAPAARERTATWLLAGSDRSPESLAILESAGASAADPGLALAFLDGAWQAATSVGLPDTSLTEALVDASLAEGDVRRALEVAIAGKVKGSPLQRTLARAGRMSDAAGVTPTPSSAEQVLVHASAPSVQWATGAVPADQSPPGSRASSQAEALGPEAALAAFVQAADALLAGSGTTARHMRDLQRLVGDGVDTTRWPLDPTSCAAIVAYLATQSLEVAAAPDDDNADRSFAELRSVTDAWVAMRAGRLRDATLKLAEPALDPLAEALGAIVDAASALRADNLDALGPGVQKASQLLERVQVDAWRAPLVADLLAPAQRCGQPASMVTAELEQLLSTTQPGSLLRLSCAGAALWAAVGVDDEAAVHAALEAFADIEGTTAAHQLYAQVLPVVRVVFGTDQSDDTEWGSGASPSDKPRGAQPVSKADAPIDAEAVLQAATLLRDAGLAYDAGRLTAAAAMRTTSEADAKALLKASRSMRQERKASAKSGGDVTELSEREIEVGRLVVQGRTHKEVGAQLFISAKTVEHHVARIRTKLGATNRAEMMTAIRAYIDDA